MAPPTKDSQNQTSSEAINGVESEGRFINMVTNLVLNQHLPRGKLDGKVVDFKHPKELENLLDLSLKKEGTSPESLEKTLQTVIDYSLKTSNPRFYNQLYQGVDEAALAGDWLSEALNTNQHTFEVSPVFMVIERVILRRVCDIANWPSGDGIFSPGGSIGNMYGMVMARYKVYPDVKSEGTWGKKPLVAFASQDAHYSVLKSAHWMGLGTNNVIYVKTDEGGSMIPEELEKKIEEVKKEGRLPFFVNATAGTTVLGAYDPLGPLADICEKHGMWLHVDGAWGGSAMISNKYKHLMAGLNRVDSFIWNPHKMLGVPLQCTIFVTKHKGMLHHCNSASATYLFQQDKFYDVSYDTGDKSVQCGRKVDAFKLWVMWKVRGDKALASRVDNAYDQSRYLRDLACSTPGFRMVYKDIAAPNVCFWYIPKRLRGQTENDEWWEELSQVAPKIKEKMTMSGSMMVGYNPLPHKGLKNFFRFVISSMPERTKEDMEFIIEEIQRLGEEC